MRTYQSSSSSAATSLSRSSSAPAALPHRVNPQEAATLFPKSTITQNSHDAGQRHVPKIKDSFRSLLRATGLKIISMVPLPSPSEILRSPHGLSNAPRWLTKPLRGLPKSLRGSTEPKKVLITKSWVIALCRASVHCIPIFISICLIVLNIRGTLLGPSLSSRKTFALQFLSKVHVGSTIFNHLYRMLYVIALPRELRCIRSFQ